MQADDWMMGTHPLDMLEAALPTASPASMWQFAAEVCRQVGRADASVLLNAVAEGRKSNEILLELQRENLPQNLSKSNNPRRLSKHEQQRRIVYAAANRLAHDSAWNTGEASYPMLQRKLIPVIQCSFVNPLRALIIEPTWRTSTVLAIAGQMYETSDFTGMPILADALQDAGCEHPDILSHCRGEGPHVQGCWVIDHLLGKV